MKTRLSIAVVLPAAFILLLHQGIAAYGQTGTAVQKLTPMSGPIDVGIIFSVPDLLLGLESYQAGLGAKLGLEKVDYRVLFDVTINGTASSFSFQGGLAAEFHLTPDPLSFYWGGVANAGFMSQPGSVSALSLSLGAIAGIEVFPFEFVSIFVEYCLETGFKITWTSLGTSPEVVFLADAGMGNDGRVGIVIYFLRTVKKKK
jgi:hypothetical protein